MASLYFDNNATTRLAPEAFEAMRPWLEGDCGNPSSLHFLGTAAADAVARARGQVAKLIGAAFPREVAFTSGGTESNTAAIRSAVRVHPDRRRIVATAVEHPAILEPLDELARRGYDIARVGVDRQGRLDIERMLGAIGPDCALVTAMWANNETGAVHDVKAVGEAARAHGVPFHVDGVQAAGRIPIHVESLPIDTCSFSAHKLHGPKGVGALYVRRTSAFEPLLRGGGQEEERRAGTENVPGIVGFGRAAELASAWLADPANVQRLTALRDQLERELCARIADVDVHAKDAVRVPNTANLRFDGVSGEALLMLLSHEGVCVSTGSACASLKQAPSHVLLAMGESIEQASSSLRFSLSRYTGAQELAQLVEIVPRLVADLRALGGELQSEPATA
jgi:cysteine desulfurase